MDAIAAVDPSLTREEQDLAESWVARLRGYCPGGAAERFAGVLAAEGLDPEDAATFEELAPELLTALGVDDVAVRECILALKPTQAGDREAHRLQAGARQPELQRAAASSTAADPKTALDHAGQDTEAPVFERRVFKSSDRRGAKAQEVIPLLFLGGFKAAIDAEEQRRLGITHIVNCTAWDVGTRDGVEVMTLALRDGDGDQDISQHFARVIAFIDRAHQKGGGVLVHCIRGVSRSTTLVCAYLLAKNGRCLGGGAARAAGPGSLRVEEALALAREARPVAKPRHGFIEQLRAFERQLRKKSTERQGA